MKQVTGKNKKQKYRKNKYKYLTFLEKIANIAM